MLLFSVMLVFSFITVPNMSAFGTETPSEGPAHLEVDGIPGSSVDLLPEVLPEELEAMSGAPLLDAYASEVPGDTLYPDSGYLIGVPYSEGGSQSWVPGLEPMATAAKGKVRLTGMQLYDYAYKALKLVNQERAKYGRSALNMNAALMDDAMQRAAEIAVLFSHTRPDGSSCSTVPSVVGSSSSFGENIAAGQGSPDAMIAALMASPGHKDNILFSDYKSVGVGCFVHEGRIYWVQIFKGTASSTPSQPSNSTVYRTVNISSSACTFINVELLSDSILNVGEAKSCRLMIGNANATATSYTFTPDSDYGITWSSSNTTYIQALASGHMKGAAPGTATLKGEIPGIFTVSKSVTVKGTAVPPGTTTPGITTPTLDPPSVTTPPGGSTATSPGTPAPAANKLTISYATHVQNIGWQLAVSDGAMSGSIGKGYRLEGLTVKIANNTGYPGGIKYATHIQKIGWQKAVSLITNGTSNGAVQGGISGTTGRSLRLEAMTMELTGELAKHYDLYYRVHAQNVGWMGWAKNGDKAGTAGQGLRLEALQVCVLPKGSPAPANTFKGFTAPADAPYLLDPDTVSYALGHSAVVHIQSVGDKYYASATGNTLLGTTGRGLRLEALTLSLKNSPYVGSLKYQTHIQSIGWQDAKVNGQLSGTAGRGLRLEALRISLTGDMAKHYDVYYRTHIQRFGWTGWAKNGQSCGSAGYGYRMESMQIVIVPKGYAPGLNSGYFFQK